MLDICKRLLCPDQEAMQFAAPRKGSLRHITIKIDLLHLLSRRVFARPGDADQHICGPGILWLTLRHKRIMTSSASRRRLILARPGEQLGGLGHTEKNFNASSNFEHGLRSLPCKP